MKVNQLPYFLYTSFYILNDNSIASLNLINWTNPLINYKVDDYVEKKNLHFKLKGEVTYP